MEGFLHERRIVFKLPLLKKKFKMATVTPKDKRVEFEIKIVPLHTRNLQIGISDPPMSPRIDGLIVIVGSYIFLLLWLLFLKMKGLYDHYHTS